MAMFTPAAPQPKATNELPRIGKGWIKSDKNGKAFIAISIDKEEYATFAKLEINPGDCLMVFNNEKRPGKKDADYTVHLVMPSVATCEETI